MSKTVRTISWDDHGASLEMVHCINDAVPFVLLVGGPLAKVLLTALGPGPVGIRPEEVRLLIAILSILGVAGLVLFALGKGCKVSGKVHLPEGTQYELSFEPLL